MVEPYVRVLSLYVLDDRPPQPAGRQHVGLVHRRYPAVAPLRCLESHPRYPFYLLAGVDGEIARLFFAFDLLPKVGAAGQLANDEDVYTLDDLLLQGRGVEQRRDRRHRPQVGEHAQGFSKLQEPAFGARRPPIEVRMADSSEQDSVRSPRPLQRLFRDRLAFFPDRCSPYLALLVGELYAEVPGGGVHHRPGGLDDLRSDAVARQ